MRSKLHKFTEFARGLLPHETAYLLSVQQFDDKVKLSVLERIDANCRNLSEELPYDESVDKRKYSNLKQWMTERLHAADVDTEFEWLLEAERQIETDSIAPDTEERLLSRLQSSTPGAYHFVKYYELAQLYRHFLLIRMRHEEHRLVEQFLDRFRPAYERARDVREQLHQATRAIVGQYAGSSTDSMPWEPRLTEVFYDETLDGWNRYMALVRLTFLYYNYQRFEPVREKYNYLDALFRQGKYYSKRLLINYYGNRLLLHSRFQEHDEAEYYGYLSVRVKTADYIHYVNNLCAVLLRRKKYEAALQVMKAALPESRTTHSFHNRIGFVAHYLRCLNHTQQYRAAENYAETYLRAYRKEILAHRWFAFFSACLETQLLQKNYSKILRLIDKHQLLERDRGYTNKSAYLPTIPWYHAVAARRMGRISDAELTATLRQTLETDRPGSNKLPMIRELLLDLEPHAPGPVAAMRENGSLDGLSR